MKKATVFIKGGLGNQLFQFSFAKFLEQNNYSVNINTNLLDAHGNNTRRSLIFPTKYFGFNEQSSFSKKKFDYFMRLHYSKIISNSYFGKYFEDYKYSKEDTNISNQESKLYFLNGYWKNMKYLDYMEDFIISSISKNPIIKDGFKSQLQENYAMIHVRRRDFIKNNWHLDISFYEESINLIKNKSKKIKFDIFTDDENWVKKQKIFSHAMNIYPQKRNEIMEPINHNHYIGDDKEETIKTFSKMLKYRNFIVGNSSFAFWAAFLRSDKNSIVTVPDPWFRNNDHQTLKKANWITVKNN